MFILISIIFTWLSFANPIKQLPFLIIFYPLIFIHNSNKHNNIKSTIKYGWFFGSVVFSSCLYWIAYPVANYSNVPLVVATACPVLLGMYLGLYPAIFSGILFYIKEKNWIIRGIIGGITWSFLEYIREYFLTGFPWLNITQAICSYSKFIQPIQIVGEIIFSGIIVTIAIWIYEIKNKKLIPTFIGIISVLLIYMWGIYLYNLNIASKKYISSIIVQGNIDQYVKWDSKFKKYTLDKYIKLTDVALSKSKANKTPLVIWPETAMPFYLENKDIFTLKLLNYTKNKNIMLITGSPAYEIHGTNIKWFNRAYLIYHGELKAHYDKVHLVPFGEYIPFSTILGFLNKIVEGPGNFSQGKGLYPLIKGNLAMGTLICYEIIFPDLVAEVVNNNAQLLVNISNDAWFGDTSGPYQHLNQAIVKAIETKRFVLRATNTGISAIISPKGDVLKRLPLDKEGFLIYDNVALMDKKTFFVKHHNILRWGTIFAFLTLMIRNL